MFRSNVMSIFKSHFRYGCRKPEPGKCTPINWVLLPLINASYHVTESNTRLLINFGSQMEKSPRNLKTSSLRRQREVSPKIYDVSRKHSRWCETKLRNILMVRRFFFERKTAIFLEMEMWNVSGEWSSNLSPFFEQHIKFSSSRHA